VTKITLPQPASDDVIWNYAKENGYCIVTNDEDFLNLLLKNGFPPKLILLRTGNQSTTFIREVLLKHSKDIRALEKTDDYGVLEIFG
jgi:predicted nuclease of predicted toxin-antitoxin system